MIWKSKLGVPVCMSLAVAVDTRLWERRLSRLSGASRDLDTRHEVLWMLP